MYKEVAGCFVVDGFGVGTGGCAFLMFGGAGGIPAGGGGNISSTLAMMT